MARVEFPAAKGRRMVIGSFGAPDDLLAATAESVASDCDMAEIRLDLLAKKPGDRVADSWKHLRGLPLLFTARRSDEGGAGGWDATTRAELLESALDDATCIDLEVASIGECAPLLRIIGDQGLPWVASFHDFKAMPCVSLLESKAHAARDAGAAIFKAAVWLHTPGDAARLAEFQLADHGIPVATMGMGPLAAVSRLLCAQCGSVLNYGFIGNTPTAPGQWSAPFLREAIARLAAFPS